MDVTAGLMKLLGGGLTTVLAFLFVLSIVVFVHEMGHFLVARWCGVRVETFSIGFGREIGGFNDRHGTRWRLAWIPLGGYVKFAGDDNGASVPDHEAIANMSAAERAGSFHAKPVWQRAAVVAAGPLANFLLAAVIFSASFMAFGVRTIEPRVGGIVAGSPAAKSGFEVGDLVVSIDRQQIDSFDELQRIVSLSPGQSLAFVVDRSGRRVDIEVAPRLQEHEDQISGKHRRPMIGIQAGGPGVTLRHTPVGPVQAVGLGLDQVGKIITSTLSFVQGALMGRQDLEQLGGPLRIADYSGKIAQIGPEALISFVAVISVSVGLINLFPIPLLDGGHLMFYAIEAVRRRPLSERTQEIGFRVGLAIILMLMVLSTWNDRVVVQNWLNWGS